MNNFIEVFSGTSTKFVLLSSSFIGGIIASVSPCSLAMLPIVIGYIGGYSNKSVSKTLMQLCSFVFGSAIVFSIIGIICAVTGKVFISFAGNYFMLFIAGLLLIMGLNLVGILDLNIPILVNKIPQSKGKSLFLYPMLLGATFALAGTPCSTPILAGIMGIASASSNILLSILMLFLFALGEGVVLIIAGLFTSILKHSGAISKFSEILLKVSGFILILVSIYFYTKIFMPLLVN